MARDLETYHLAPTITQLEYNETPRLKLNPVNYHIIPKVFRLHVINIYEVVEKVRYS
jgi:hypothetical protein